MDEKIIKRKMFELRFKISLLSKEERDNEQHPLYIELKELKKEYMLSYMEKVKKERLENGKYKRK